MDMTEMHQYQKAHRFSKLGKLQQKSEIHYHVKCLPGNLAYYTVRLTSNQQVMEEQLKLVCITPAKACMIVDFLCENAVGFSCWKDVVLDAAAKI